MREVPPQGPRSTCTRRAAELGPCLAAAQLPGAGGPERPPSWEDGAQASGTQQARVTGCSLGSLNLRSLQGARGEWTGGSLWAGKKASNTRWGRGRGGFAQCGGRMRVRASTAEAEHRGPGPDGPGVWLPKDSGGGPNGAGMEGRVLRPGGGAQSQCLSSE